MEPITSTAADVPDYFICPITLEMMRDPVISKCGHMFDKEAIYKWLKGEYDPTKRNISRACPVCHTVLDETALSPCYPIKTAIEDFLSSTQNKNVDPASFRASPMMARLKEKLKFYRKPSKRQWGWTSDLIPEPGSGGPSFNVSPTRQPSSPVSNTPRPPAPDTAELNLSVPLPVVEVWAHLTPVVFFHRLLPLNREKFLIGRHATCHGRITLSEISSRHCYIWRQKSGEGGLWEVFIEDRSTNGTYVNGRNLGKGSRRQLFEGDEIALGRRLAGRKEVTDVSSYLDWVFIGTSALQVCPDQVTLAKTGIPTFQALVSMSDGDLIALGINNSSVRQTILAAVEGWKHDHRFPGYQIHFHEPEKYVINPALAIEDSLEDIAVEEPGDGQADSAVGITQNGLQTVPPTVTSNTRENSAVLPQVGQDSDPTDQLLPPSRTTRESSPSPEARGTRNTMIRADAGDTVLSPEFADQTLAMPMHGMRENTLTRALAPLVQAPGQPTHTLSTSTGDAGSERTATRDAIEEFNPELDIDLPTRTATDTLNLHGVRSNGYQASSSQAPVLPMLQALDTNVKKGSGSEPHSATTVNVLSEGLAAAFMDDPVPGTSANAMPNVLDVPHGQIAKKQKEVAYSSDGSASDAASDEDGNPGTKAQTRDKDARSMTQSSTKSSSARPNSTGTRGTSVVGDGERPTLRSRGSTRSMQSNSTGDGTAYQRSDEGESSGHIKTEPQTPSGETTPPPNSPSKGPTLLTKRNSQSFAAPPEERNMYDEVLLNKLKHMFPSVDAEVFEIVVKYEKLNVLLESSALNGGGNAAGAGAQRAQGRTESANSEQSSTLTNTDDTSSNRGQLPKQQKTWGRLLNSSANVSCASISYDNWRTVEERVIRKIRQIDG